MIRMDAKISTVNWQKPIALGSTPVIFDIPYTEVNIFPVIQNIQSNHSFLHSQKLKQSIIESKRAFLNLSLNDQKAEDEQMEEKSLVLGNLDGKKSISKKISFKIKKQTSVYKRNIGPLRVTNIPVNRVSELTKKFNEMVEQHNVSEEQFKMSVKRRDSMCSETEKTKKPSIAVVHKDSLKVSRKPSVKTKPLLESKHLVIIKTKPTRKTSIKKQNCDNVSVQARIGHTEKLIKIKKPDEQVPRPTTLNLNLKIPKAIIETSPNGTSVRAAIEIFERRSAVSSPTKNDSKDFPNIVSKPKVPDKSIAIRNLSKTATLPTSFKVSKNVQANIFKDNDESVKQRQVNILPDNNKKNKAEFEDDKVQIINIPAVLPQRRCDSMYETLNLKKISPPAIKSKSVDNINNEIENKQRFSVPNTSFLWKDKSLYITSDISSTNDNLQGSINKPNISENTKKIPPDIPFKPPLDLIKPVTPQKILKKKMPLPSPPNVFKKQESENQLADYEEIGCNMSVTLDNVEDMGPDEIILSDEKFKGYDEIIKPVNDVEIIKTETINSVTHYEEIKKSLTNVEYSELNTLRAKKYYEEINTQEKIYEELVSVNSKNDDGYEPIGNKVEDDLYERFSLPATENIYETLPVPQISLRRQQQEPLPPRPPSSTKNEETVYNCYESIYTETKKDGYYESIYGSQLTDSGSNRDSVLSSDHKSNSLYGKSLPMWDYNSDATYYKPPSDASCSDRLSNRSDEWEDVTDNDEEDSRIIIVREKAKGKKSGWSQHFREQLSKSLKEPPPGVNQSGDETDHHYESLYTTKEDEDFYYDSFESDSDSDSSFDKIRIVDDSGIDIGSSQLPAPPNSQTYGLMKFAEKHMKKIKQNFSIDITKSLTRMKKHISKTDSDISGLSKDEKKTFDAKPKLSISSYENVEIKNPAFKQQIPYQTVEMTKNASPESQTDEQDKSKTLTRKGGFLNKFRRSMSLSAESANELTSNLNGNKTKSTFYLTEAIDIDNVENQKEYSPKEDKSLSPILRQTKSPVLRPTSPPPPAPMSHSNLRKSNRRDGKSTSWYADSGLFRNTENTSKRPNTFWYAEVGLYQSQTSSPPSTSSAENSGSNLSTPIKPFEIPRPVLKTSDFINQDDNEHYNNMKNDTAYYTDSVNSFSSLETKKDESLKQEIQLRLQDEPLYQFYDAAVLESISYGDTSDFDSDNYEDISEKEVVKQIKIRPSAMELVSPKRNSICFTKTLWCEIPEVINSSVLSTLSAHQKKIQEAKFEILTSEASYLNSLNVLSNHFIKNLNASNILTEEDYDILFGHVEEVRNSSEKLLHDLEKCWQDNILLHGICDIIQKHAEENFNVYIPYCENQILFDETLKGLKKRVAFAELLKQLEMSEACQSLFLYSFLMLPMQRITRWPLLVDAVLKRLDQQDAEYYACQFALATLNKIVSQCNEAARKKERQTELQRIAKQLEFPQNIPKIPIFCPERWLIRCGQVTHIQTRNDDTKLTFGKRFNKSSIYLFLFNNLFLVTKEKSEKCFVVQNYCLRNLVELSSSETILTVPTKETQGKNLIFLTVLENQDGRTIEYLLSCNSESDKERWIEALSTPKSEDPEETLYECWDCPQVSAIHSYAASQPDELALTKGDVINVLRKMADGWYHGERIRDGQTGWFPANHTVEIANFHVRARNLKQRYRLLAFSENYLKSK